MLSAAAFAQETAGGSSFSYGAVGPLQGSSGRPDFDQALAITLAKLSDWFDVRPTFSFYREHDGRGNAWAMREHGSQTDGSVAYGLALLDSQFQSANRPAAHVAAVCAHEFGHIAQYKRGAVDVLAGSTVRRVELHADFLAGYFAGRRRRELPTFPAAEIAQAQFNAGDHQRTHPSHHGTPDERGQAVVAGYHAAFTRQLSFDDAFAWGLEAARRW